MTEPGGALESAASLALNGVASGTISPSSDVDYFQIVLDQTTDIFLRGVSTTVGIAGELVDDMDMAVPADFDQYSYGSSGMGFALSDRLAAGTYYLKVSRSSGASTGKYAVSLVDEERLQKDFSSCLTTSASIDDPLYGCQWHLENTGQGGGTSGEDIGVRQAWDAGRMGTGIGVAVVDNGMDAFHRDLLANVDASLNYDYERSSNRLQVAWHGTAVAGLIAARDNAVGGRA